MALLINSFAQQSDRLRRAKADTAIAHGTFAARHSGSILQRNIFHRTKLYNQPTTTFTPLETVQTGACTYKIFVYKSADISYNESAML